MSKVCGSKKLYNALLSQAMSETGTTMASLDKEIEAELLVSLSWTRPKNIPYPNVWEKFEVKSKNGCAIKLKIEDVTPDRYEEFLDFQFRNYDCQEPVSKSIDLISDLKSVIAIRKIRRKILDQKVSIIITLQDEENAKIIGARNLMVLAKKDPPFKVTGEKLTRIFDLYSFVEKDINPFKLLNSNVYFVGTGAAIEPEYSGLGVASRLASTVSQMGKLWNIPGIVDTFSSPVIQKVGEKAGFKLYKEVVYEDYKDNSGKPVFPLKGTFRYMIGKSDGSQFTN